MPRTSPYAIKLSPEEKAVLAARARKYSAPYREVVRAKIVLMAAEGMENKEIAASLSLPPQTVSKWRKRFFEERISGLAERPRRPSRSVGPPHPSKVSGAPAPERRATSAHRTNGRGRPRTLPEDVRLRIRGLHESGMSLGAIARKLNEEDVERAQGGRWWYASTVKAVLKV